MADVKTKEEPKLSAFPEEVGEDVAAIQSAVNQRIDAVIREAYALRGKPLPVFGPADRLAFAGNKALRWLIKVPQRISRWPGKIRRRILKKRRDANA